MTERPFTIRRTKDELTLLQVGVWHWEDTLQSSRLRQKKDRKDPSKSDRAIARCRNLKARLFRLKPGGG